MGNLCCCTKDDDEKDFNVLKSEVRSWNEPASAIQKQLVYRMYYLKFQKVLEMYGSGNCPGSTIFRNEVIIMYSKFTINAMIRLERLGYSFAEARANKVALIMKHFEDLYFPELTRVQIVEVFLVYKNFDKLDKAALARFRRLSDKHKDLLVLMDDFIKSYNATDKDACEKVVEKYTNLEGVGASNSDSNPFVKQMFGDLMIKLDTINTVLKKTN